MRSLIILTFCFILRISFAQQSTQGLRAEYYQGLKFNKKVVTRIDPEINFHWNRRHKPTPTIQFNNFSVRWSGQLYAPESGSYFFSSVADDEVKVWINGIKILDNKQQPMQGKMLNPAYIIEKRGVVNLQGKEWVNIEVEYSNGIGDGVALLYWELPSDTRSQLGYQGIFRKIIATHNFRPTLKLTPSTSITVNKPTVQKANFFVKPAKPVSQSIRHSPKPEVDVILPELKLEKKKIVILHQVQFTQSSYVLVPDSYPILNQLVSLLKQNPAQRIIISGHTDNIGDARLNFTLSEYRAKRVASYLSQQGITVDRIETKGFGGEQPITDNKTEIERAKNRRVEVVLL